MTNDEFADEMIDRLNVLCEVPDVRDALSRLAGVQVRLRDENSLIRDHSTLQCGVDGRLTTLGLLGVLNGIAGIEPDTEIGFVAAVVVKDDIIKFQRSVAKKN